MASPESCVMFALAVVVVLVVSFYKADFFRPSVLYFFVQMVMLGVAYLKLVPAMTDFKLTTWLVWGGGLMAFIGGSVLTEMVWTSKGGARMPQTFKLHGEYNWTTHFFASFLAFAYFMIGVIGIVSVVGSLIIFADRPSLWLSGIDSPVLKFSDFFMSGAMVVGLFSVSSFKSLNPVRWVRYASRFMVVFTMVLSFMAFPNRGINMLCLGMFLLLFNYLHGRFTWKTLSFVVVFIVIFFVVVASLKGQYGDDSAEDLMKNKMVQKIALLPYMYVANNYWNLDYALNQPVDASEHEWTYGMDAFYGITQMFRVGDGLRSSFGWDSPFNESSVKVKSLNTIPFLWDAYKDFGLLGIFFEPFFFGILFTWMYRRMAVAKTPLGILVTCVFLMWIVFWNFTTGYKQSMYWVWMGFFALVCTLSSGKGILPMKSAPAQIVDQKKDTDDSVAGQGE